MMGLNQQGGSMKNIGSFMDDLEADLLRKFKEITPEQLAADEQKRKAQSEYEALHTTIETDEDRANKDEYPDEDEDE
jgi:hypothetical protein